MLFSYNWLQSFFKRKLPEPKKLKEILTMHSFEVEDLNKIKIGSKVDWQLDIDVLPNRTDCYSHLGIAKEISAILNYKLQPENWKLKEEKNLKTKDFLSLKVTNGLKRYTGKVILEPKIKESPKWIKERLEACGLKPINNIVDITNYVMLELGQPLHAFDLEKIEGKEVIVRFAKEGEKILTLDDEEYSLSKDILVIADQKKPIAIAGIKGGKETGISDKTKMVFLESANFDPVIIRRGSIKLNLKTDASLRFSHGIDPNLTQLAIERASFLIQKICQGKVAEGVLDFYPKKVYPKKIVLEKDYLESLLGIKISTQKIVKILNNLGLKTDKNLMVEIPTIRRDISFEEDLIEEVGRIYGYQRIKPSFPTISLIPPKENEEFIFKNKIKEILKSIGFVEVYNYSFIGEREKEIFGFKDDIVELMNPISSFYKYLRPSLIPNLLKNVSFNLKYFNDIKIFELGKVFKRDWQKKLIEDNALTILISRREPKEEIFFELKGVSDFLLKGLGISNFFYDEFKPVPEKILSSLLHHKKTAEIKVGDKKIGFLGEISPLILKELRINHKVVILDFNFKELIELSTEEREYLPPSIYPSVIRDLSLLVPLEVKVDEVLNIINLVSEDLVKDVELFDIYEDEAFGGRKSLSFRIVYQAEDRTLRSEEVEKVHQKIIKALEKNPNWEVRK